MLLKQIALLARRIKGLASAEAWVYTTYSRIHSRFSTLSAAQR